ncbi:MAG: efflux RND transporter periplasmic adaptor subunit [Acidobacteriota bacterium]
MRFFPWIVPATLLLISCASPSSNTPQGEEEQLAPPVEAVEARLGTLPLEERLSGVVRAANQVVIRPQIEAPILEVLVESGERVREGQPLVRLDDEKLRDQLRQAEASVRLAEAQGREADARVAELEAQVTRWRSLAAEEVVSRLDLETLEARLEGALASAEQSAARVEQAAATADERRADIADALVRAPSAGHVGRRNAEPGMLVGAQSELFVLGSLERLKIEAPLTEAMIARLRPGMTVEIRADSLSSPLRASLSRISPFLSGDSFSTLGEIDLDQQDGALRPGMFVTVDVLYGETETSTLIPASAAWEDPRTGERVTYVVDAATADGGVPGPELGTRPLPVERRTLRILAEGRSTVGVEGVEPGEWVVTVGQQLLGAGEDEKARVRAASWDRLIELQSLQQENLLADFMAKQQRLAREIGIEPPESDVFAADSRLENRETGSPPEGQPDRAENPRTGA